MIQAGSSLLFEHLPPDLFRLLTGRARWFYAELLEFIDRTVLGGAGGVIPRHELLDALRLFVQRRNDEFAETGSDEDADFTAATEPERRAEIAYSRLLQTGWLVEHRDRYRRLVDFDANARLLLEALLDIKAGHLRSYGGEVLQVLTLLEAARGDPQNRSEALRNAARSAKSFLNHLRSVSSAMRQVEEALAIRTDLKSFFQSVFEDFVAKHLVEDYKRLHTRANPFRFRTQIIDVAIEIEFDALRMRELADAYVREGRAPDAERGLTIIAEELKLIGSVFTGLDEHLDLIEETSRRVQRRLRNTVRFMDRIAETRTERLKLALQGLGESGLAPDAIVNVPARLMEADPPLGKAHLFQAAQRRRPIECQPIRRQPADPALTAYQEAVQGYRTRIMVTPSRVRAWLEAALGDRPSIMACELPLDTLDDFFVFERIRSIAFLEGGVLADEYDVETHDGLFESDWIVCPNFIVHRRRGHHAAR